MHKRWLFLSIVALFIFSLVKDSFGMLYSFIGKIINCVYVFVKRQICGTKFTAIFHTEAFKDEKIYAK